MEDANYLLGICGSPRKQGTEFAIQYALNYAAEKFGFNTEFWSVRNKNIKFFSELLAFSCPLKISLWRASGRCNEKIKVSSHD